MPRLTRPHDTPPRLKQTTLAGFLSPSSSSHHSSPVRPSARRRGLHDSSPVASSDAIVISDTEDETGSDVENIHFEAKNVNVSDDSLEAPRPSIPARNNRKVRLLRVENSYGEPNRSKSSSVLSVESVLDGESEEPVEWTKKRKGKSLRVEESDSEGQSRPQRRKLVKGIRPLTPDNDGNLIDEVDEERILEKRFRSRDRKTTFQQNLEKLRMRKRGVVVKDFPDLDEEESQNSEDIVPFVGAKPGVERGASSSSEEDMASPERDDFIVEDDGKEPIPELPLMFSMGTHQELVHHFKVICQFFVHLAVRPASERKRFMEKTMLTNEYFSVPLQIARRKLSAMRDSLVTSSIWRPAFKKALEAHPSFELLKLDFAIPQCDACQLGSRMSTLLGRLTGASYDKLTFEPLANDPEDDSNLSENKDCDAIDFHLGRFCAKRARAFHKFSHWECTLFRALANEVRSLQSANTSRRFVRVAYASGIQPPEDISDADAIMDWLDERKIIEMEWRRIQDMMESARNLETAVKGGADRDD